MKKSLPFKKIQRRSPQNNEAKTVVDKIFLSEEEKFPLVFLALFPGIHLPTWIDENRVLIQNELKKYGAILFRNFSVSTINEFETAAKSWQPDLMDYDFGSTPRSNVQTGIFTSTEYPSDQEIFLHNEMAYTKNYPSFIWFYCHKAAQEGGQTPIADSRDVCKLIGEEIVSQFENRKIKYWRNYRPGLDVPWTEVFQTQDKQEVANYCEANNIEFEWVTENHLRTKEVCDAVKHHPLTQEKVWFNQAHLFHPSNLDEAFSAQLASLPVEDLPRNVTWADGGAIDPVYLEKIRTSFRQAKTKFDWKRGDVILLDNLLVSHGREPFIGERKILVAMQGNSLS